MWKVAFGFDKGSSETVPTGGKKLIEHHQDLACKLFVDGNHGNWSEEDLPALWDVVKNRINSFVFFFLSYYFYF